MDEKTPGLSAELETAGLRKPVPLPDHKFLHECFSLDPEAAGSLVWKRAEPGRFKTRSAENQWNARYAGKAAGGLDSLGYWRVSIRGQSYKIHRIIFALFYGYEPDEIDHIDGDPSNNNPANLRAATASQNQSNTSSHSHNTSGFKGVSYHKHTGKWMARIRHARSEYYIGIFQRPEDAHAAYCEAAKKIHGEFWRGQ